MFTPGNDTPPATGNLARIEPDELTHDVESVAMEC
jgi:hypothetical protein